MRELMPKDESSERRAESNRLNFEPIDRLDILRIDHDHGFLELNIEAFFPCTRQKARIVFPLIRKWCGEDAKSQLLAELMELAEGYEALCCMYGEAAASYPPKSRQWRSNTAKLKRTNVLLKRMRNNIRMLTEVQYGS